MRRDIAAAVLMVFAGAGASAAAQAPLRLEATQSSSQAPATSPAGQAAGTSQTADGTGNAGATGTQTPTQSGTTTSHSSHWVTVKFDYDFARTPACSAKVKIGCVEKFVAYDISAGVKHRAKLFEIPLPPSPVGLVPGIKQRSPAKLDFESGKHLISVVAREPDGTESRHRACTTWIEIP
ncbi:MAG: hypothetical protein WAN97_17550 [Candidatus Acidiferrales bacterium]